MPQPILKGQKLSTTSSDMVLKVLVIGDYGVGKTAVVRRYTEGRFSSNYKTTIGVEFSSKKIVLPNSSCVTLQLWEIAGNARFAHLTRAFYKNASAAVIVFDISRSQTFDSLQKWLDDVRVKVMLPEEKPIPVIILANKVDILGASVKTESLDRLCRNNNLFGWFKTSAKENVNVDGAIEQLVYKTTKILNNQDAESDQHSISLIGSDKKPWYCCY